MSYDQWKTTDQLGEQESAYQARLEAKAKEIRDGMTLGCYVKEIECDASNDADISRAYRTCFLSGEECGAILGRMMKDFAQKWLDKEAMRQAVDALARGE